MFERHFGLRENPFHSGHQLRFLYPSREHQEARAHLRYGIENREPFVLITGEVGTGKTTALYDALDEWGSQVAVALITNSALTRQELLEEICLRFGLAVPPGTSKPQALAQLERHLTGVRTRGEHAVLILDEAQNLATELLEEIRLLSNLETRGEKLVQIFLVGQPELEAKLARPELRQLRQRITVHYRLNPLSPEETAGYIHHRISVAGGNAWVVFPPEACREVFRITHGIPREINTVASQALITAFSENSPGVRAEHVRVVAQESEFLSVLGEAPADAPELGGFAAPPRSALASPPSPPPAASAPPVQGTQQSPRPQSSPPPAAPPPASPPAAWSPPPAPEPPAAQSGVEFVDKREMDAWSAAASQLLEAKRRLAAAAPTPALPSEQLPIPPIAIAPPLVAASLPAAAPPTLPREDGARHPAHDVLGTQHSAQPPAAPAPLANLPGRLRDKLGEELAAEEAGARGRLPMILGAIAVAAILVSLVLLQRFQVIDVPLLRGLAGSVHAAAPAAMLPAGAPHQAVASPLDSALRVHAAAARDSGVRPANVAKPKPVPLHAPAAAATPSAPKPALPDDTIYGIGVASYLDESRASMESAKLSDDTRLPGRVMPYSDNGTTMYRVVIGNWPTRGAAETAASRLVARAAVREARVMAIGKSRPR